MFNKIDFIWLGIALFIGLPFQLIWAIIFWDNFDLFMGHWLVALVAIVMVFCWLPYFILRKK